LIRVALIDDQELVRTGFRVVLEAQPDMTVVGEAADGLAAVALAAGRPQPDVMVMDVRMPRLDSVGATQQICAAGDRPRVLMLTTFDLDEYAFAALKAGASGFLLKDVPPHELLFAIRSVHSGDAVVAPSTTKRLIDRFVPLLPAAGAEAPPDLAELTEREREVLIHMAAGLSNGDRRTAGRRRSHDQDPRRPDPEQARPARPGPVRRTRPRERSGEATSVLRGTRIPPPRRMRETARHP
jgi:DNA-binding NarL/FixJ family response regulator